MHSRFPTPVSSRSAIVAFPLAAIACLSVSPTIASPSSPAADSSGAPHPAAPVARRAAPHHAKTASKAGRSKATGSTGRARFSKLLPGGTATATETNATPSSPVAVDLAPDPFTPAVNIWVQNPGKAAVTSRIVLTNPDNFLGAGRSVQSITVPPKGRMQAKFTLPAAAMAPDSRYAFTAEVDSTPGAHLTATRLLSFFRIERAWQRPALAGSLDGWLNASMIIVNVPGRPAGKPGWKGRDDLTATARFLWDPTYLYFMARRTDDVVRLATSPEDSDGDRVRIALSPTGSHLADAPWVTLDLVPLEAGLVVTRRSSPALKLKAGPITGIEGSVSDQDGVTVLVAAIPWTEAGLTKGVKLKRLGLTVRAIDDDGDGAKGWLEWGGGAGIPPDPPSFSDVSLGD